MQRKQKRSESKTTLMRPMSPKRAKACIDRMLRQLISNKPEGPQVCPACVAKQVHELKIRRQAMAKGERWLRLLLKQGKQNGMNARTRATVRATAEMLADSNPRFAKRT